MSDEAIRALVSMLRNEYPHDRSIADIVRIWGPPVSDEAMTYLAKLEQESNS